MRLQKLQALDSRLFVKLNTPLCRFTSLPMNCLSSRYLAAVNAKQVRTVVPP